MQEESGDSPTPTDLGSAWRSEVPALRVVVGVRQDRDANGPPGQSPCRCSARNARSCATTRSWSSCCGRPGDADRTDDADVADADRHDAAVRRVLARVEPRVGVEVLAVRPERLADEHRGPAVALDDAVLAVEPAVVVGGGPGQRGVEHPLRAEPDRDRDRMLRRRGRGAQPAAELPRVVEREARELQLGVLGDESLQQLAHGRSSTLTARRSSMAAYASAASAERQLEVEDAAGLDRAREHVGQQLLDVAAHGCDAAVHADVAVEERAHRQLGAAVRRADVADHAARSRRADRLVHRLLGADALEHAVGADAAGELLHARSRRRRRARRRCAWRRSRGRGPGARDAATSR